MKNDQSAELLMIPFSYIADRFNSTPVGTGKLFAREFSKHLVRTEIIEKKRIRDEKKAIEERRKKELIEWKPSGLSGRQNKRFVKGQNAVKAVTDDMRPYLYETQRRSTSLQNNLRASKKYTKTFNRYGFGQY